jgi:hypothetical protein
VKTLWKIEFYSNGYNGNHTPEWSLISQLYLNKDTAIAKAKEFLSGDAFKDDTRPDVEVISDEIFAVDCYVGDIDEGALNHDEEITSINRVCKYKETVFVPKNQTESITVNGNVYTREVTVKTPQETLREKSATVICSESEYSLYEEPTT